MRAHSVHTIWPHHSLVLFILVVGVMLLSSLPHQLSTVFLGKTTRNLTTNHLLVSGATIEWDYLKPVTNMTNIPNKEGILNTAPYVNNELIIIGSLDSLDRNVIDGIPYDITSAPMFISKVNRDNGSTIQRVQVGLTNDGNLNYYYTNLYISGSRIFAAFSVYCNTSTGCPFIVGGSSLFTMDQTNGSVVVIEFNSSLSVLDFTSVDILQSQIYSWGLVYSVIENTLFLLAQYTCKSAPATIMGKPYDCSNNGAQTILIAIKSGSLLWARNYVATTVGGFCKPGGLSLDSTTNDVFVGVTGFYTQYLKIAEKIAVDLGELTNFIPLYERLSPSDGWLIWRQSYGKMSSRIITAFDSNNDGLYVVGVFGTGDPFNLDSSVVWPSSSAYLAKINPENGYVLWLRAVSEGIVPAGNLAQVLVSARPDTSVYFSVTSSASNISLWSSNQDLLDSLPLSAGYSRSTLIAMLDSEGNFLWTHKLSGQSGQAFRSIHPLADSPSLIVSGIYSDTESLSGRGALLGKLDIVPLCTGNCSNVGLCLADETCDCNPGYSGQNCSDFTCYGISSRSDIVCSAKGICASPDTCMCNDGAFGTDCSQSAPTATIRPENQGTVVSCQVPRFFLNVSVSPSISQFIVQNVTWSVMQNNKTVDKETIFSISSPFAPSIAKLHHGSYTIVATLQLIVLDKKNVSITTESQYSGTASCSVCSSPLNTECRYNIFLGNGIVNGSLVPISRMKRFQIDAFDQDMSISNGPITGLQLEWSTNITTKDINILSTSSSRSFSIFPLDATLGMNPNVLIDVILRFKVPYMEWMTITIRIRTNPSIDITPVGKTPLSISPEEGYSLRDEFNIQATNWLGSNLIYSFSYLDLFSGEYIRLGESTKSSIVTVLPSGNQTNYQLHVRVRVIDPDNGNFGLGESIIHVKPSFVGGLLTQKFNEAIESGNYTTTLTVASQIREASKIQVMENYDELKVLVSRILNYTASLADLNPVSVEQQFLVVNMVTQNSVILSDRDKETALDIVGNVISVDQKNSSTTLVTKGGFQNVVNIISNVATNGFTDRHVGNLTVQTAEDLAKLITSGLFIHDPPTTLTSDNFRLTVVVGQLSDLANSTVGTNSENNVDSFQIPYKFASDISVDTITSSILVFQTNPYQIKSLGESDTASSSVIDIKFKNTDGSVIPVANLTEPLMITFNRSKARSQGACSDAKFQCQYWNEDEKRWKTDGCYWIDHETDDFISCACNHTTSFSAFVLEKGDACVAYAGIKITGIVFNSIYIFICVPLLIGLFLVMHQQPIRSRFLAPFLGIVAIIVDSVLQGWIRNALSLAKKQAASDAFSYIIILTANPLFVASLFAFLWQQIRFLLLQNIYHLMPFANKSYQQKFIHLNRVLASKLVFLTVSILVGASTMAYFVILVGLAAHYNDIGSVDKRDVIVTVQAVSFAVMLIIISLGIVITLFIDITYSAKQESAATSTFDDHDSEQQQIYVKKTKGLGLLKKFYIGDPLLFRTEAGIIVIAVLIILVLYSIGIATIIQDPRPKTPIMIVRTVIELIFMFVRIFAFGGFIFIVSLKNMIQKRRSSLYKPLSSASELSSKETVYDQKVLDLLRHQAGYNLVHDYCRKEFSLENVLLWKELESLRSDNLLMSTEDRKRMLYDIQEVYIENNSVRQLNISNQGKQVFLKVAKLGEPSAADAEGALAKLYGVCMMNIADTMTRLAATEAYKNYMLAKDVSNELKDDFSSH